MFDFIYHDMTLKYFEILFLMWKHLDFVII